MLKRNNILEKILQEKEKLNNSSNKNNKISQTFFQETDKLKENAEELDLRSVYSKNAKLEREIEELIEERDKLYSLTAETDGTHKIIKEMMSLIGINTDNYINCTGSFFAEKCLDLLKEEMGVTFEDRKQGDCLSFQTTSSSSLSSDPPIEIKVSKPISAITNAPTFSFNEWRLGLLNINTPWSKVIWERWNINHLQSLDLYHNNITANGGIAIAEALKFTVSLLHLNLANNKLGDNGAEAIGGALALNTSLLTLNFNLNKISDKGAKALGEGLKFNTTLQSMSLRYNKIGNEGKSAISKNVRFKVNYEK